MGTSLRADVFPAVLSVAPASDPPATSVGYPNPEERPGTKYLEKVRVLVSMDSVYVFRDSATGPELIFFERLASYTPMPKKPAKRGFTESLKQREATLVTDSGKTLAFHRSGSCGCGSRLKSFDPFASINQYSSTNDTVTT